MPDAGYQMALIWGGWAEPVSGIRYPLSDTQHLDAPMTRPSPFPDSRCVRQLVLVVGPAFDLVLLEQLAAAGNGPDQ